MKSRRLATFKNSFVKRQPKKENNMNITELEYNVLNHIARNSYQPTNYGVPKSYDETSDIWSDHILDSGAENSPVEKKSLPGVVASLSKKGLIRHYEGTTKALGQDPSTIGLTREGFNAWQLRFDASDVSKEVKTQRYINVAIITQSGMAASSQVWTNDRSEAMTVFEKLVSDAHRSKDPAILGAICDPYHPLVRYNVLDLNATIIK